LDFLRELHAKGVDLFLHKQGLDTSTPAGRAMFQMMGVFAEFEQAMIRERVLAGLARAKEQGINYFKDEPGQPARGDGPGEFDVVVGDLGAVLMEGGAG
jgi:DNA invertase Pin-like site-specific DNA recombinase